MGFVRDVYKYGTLQFCVILRCFRTVKFIETLFFKVCVTHLRMGYVPENFKITTRTRSQNCEQRLLTLSCPSARKTVLGSHGTDFCEMRYLSVIRKSDQNSQVLLKLD